MNLCWHLSKKVFIVYSLNLCLENNFLRRKHFSIKSSSNTLGYWKETDRLILLHWISLHKTNLVLSCVAAGIILFLAVVSWSFRGVLIVIGTTVPSDLLGLIKSII